MSELYRPVPAPLPLILWRTPPGLELILAQEGIAYETIREAHPLAFRGSRFVLYDGRDTHIDGIRGLLTHEHVTIDIDSLRPDDGDDPFELLLDSEAAWGSWTVRGWELRECVGRVPKAWIRRRLIEDLRDRVTTAGGVWMRIFPFPFPFRSSFNLRVDLDEPEPEDYHRFAMARGLLADCCTHFVSTHAYGRFPDVLADLREYDAQSHGHFHHVYRDPIANRRNLERADRILRDRGFIPEAFAGPHGRWNSGLDDVLEDLGYLYSSDFQLGYDDFPFFPWKGDRFSTVLQVPVHPICEGLFLDAGAIDGRVVAEHLVRVVEEKITAEEPGFVYGHPERRLGRMPEVLISLARRVAHEPLVWRTTLTEFARWWRWRASRRFLVFAREANRFEVQCDEWDREYPLGLEIIRGKFRCLMPLSAPRVTISIDDLAFERRQDIARPIVVPPRLVPRPRSLKDAVRKALDWETVTPIDELSAASFSCRVKKGLRWWKLQRTGTGG